MFLSNPELGTKEAYVPGLTKQFVAETYGIPLEDVAKLGSAENPFGPSPRALEAVKQAARIENYPDWTARLLRAHRDEVRLPAGTGHMRRGRNGNHLLAYSCLRRCRR